MVSFPRLNWFMDGKELTLSAKKFQTPLMCVMEFEVPHDFMWQAGEQALFWFPLGLLTLFGWKEYAITSLPEDGLIKIAFELTSNLTKFEEALLSMNEGDTIMVSKPYGKTAANQDDAPHLFVAHGFGILSQIASLTKIVKRGESVVTLLYSSEDEFPFYDELNKLADEYPDFDYILFENSRLLAKYLGNILHEFGHTSYCHLSGGSYTSQEFRKYVRDFGVSKHNIHAQPF